jgi:NADPH:quinone reductase-like Zn-dependent oxidoreductase
VQFQKAAANPSKPKLYIRMGVRQRWGKAVGCVQVDGKFFTSLRQVRRLRSSGAKPLLPLCLHDVRKENVIVYIWGGGGGVGTFVCVLFNLGC